MTRVCAHVRELESGQQPGASVQSRAGARGGYTEAMAKLSITKAHHLSHAEAKQAAENVARDLRDRFALDYRWQGDCIEFSRPGLTGELRVFEAEVRLDCTLGFL